MADDNEHQNENVSDNQAEGKNSENGSDGANLKSGFSTNEGASIESLFGEPQGDGILDGDALGDGQVDGLGDDQPQNPMEALARENDALEAQVNDLKDQMLRMAAEMENLRRRTQKDVADAKSFSIASFARDMLSVTDNLRRAIEAVGEEEIAADTGGLNNLLEGVRLTEREMLNSLQKNGVKELQPLGEKFDPNFHQAMFEVQNPEAPHNSVSQVVQTGYVIGERVLRPAMVGVAKGGPKMTADPTGNNE